VKTGITVLKTHFQISCDGNTNEFELLLQLF